MDRVVPRAGVEPTMSLCAHPGDVMHCFVLYHFCLEQEVAVEDVWSERFLAWWYGYQSSRLLAFGLFGRAAWRTT